MAEPPAYYSFLLRMWQTSDGEGHTWRASLEQPGTRERQGFATLDQLFDFLKEQAALQQGHMGTTARQQVGQQPSQARPEKEEGR
jgi:hypothetical protein